MTVTLCHCATLSLGAGGSPLPLPPHSEKASCPEEGPRHTRWRRGQEPFPPPLENNMEQLETVRKRPLPPRRRISEQSFPPNSFSFPLQGGNEAPHPRYLLPIGARLRPSEEAAFTVTGAGASLLTGGFVKLAPLSRFWGKHSCELCPPEKGLRWPFPRPVAGHPAC